MSEFPHVESALAYANDVASGKISACKWVKLACKRQSEDLAKQSDDDWPYYFDEKTAERACKFIEILPHTKGKWAARGEKLIMQPFQNFKTCCIFGWLRKSNHKRRFRTAAIFEPRKNGKSPWAAAILILMLVFDREYGAECYCGATGLDQAKEVFTPARLMVLGTPALQKPWTDSEGVKYPAITVEKSNMHILENNSKAEPLIGDPGDGGGPSFATVDEYHEHSTDSLFNTMKTGMIGREAPLMLVITTTGADLSCPCFLLQKDLEAVLEGTIKDETLFGIIYTIDKGDEWSTEDALVKANPNWNVSVNGEVVLEDLERAKRDSTKQNVFKIKHLNMWVNARESWMNMEWWHRQSLPDLDISDFVGMPCWVGTDLSSKLDLTCIARLFERDGDLFLFVRHYLPEDTIKEPKNRHYQGWTYDGHLIATDGARIDIGRIELDIRDDLNRFDVRQIAYDPWGATGLEQRLSDDGAKMVELTQSTKNFSDPMKEVEARIKGGHLWHDGNPITTWCFSNVTAKVDANDNVFPRKEVFANKIDAAVATIMAMNRYLGSDDRPSVYEERGVLAI